PGHLSFRDLISRMRAGNRAADSHHELAFQRPLHVLDPARSPSRHWMFQVKRAVQNDPALNFEPSALQADSGGMAVASAEFAFSVSLSEETADGGSPGIREVVEYATDSFDRASVAALAARLVRLLEAAVAVPDGPISRLDLLDSAERDTILRQWN